MGRAVEAGRGGGAGGIAAASADLRTAISAVRLGGDWRPVVGLTPEDAGSWIERLLAEVVIEAAVKQHNDANK